MAAAVNGNTRRGEQVGGEGPVQKRMLMWERIPTQRDKSILHMVEVIGLQAERPGKVNAEAPLMLLQY